MSAEGWTIRPARAEDADAVVAMWQEMADQHAGYNAQRWDWAADAADKWRSHFLEMIGKDDWVALVAVDERDRAVGFATAHLRGVAPVFAAERAADIGNMAVAADRRRRGIGKLLTAAALAELRSRGAEYATLGVAWTNDAARKLYEGLGFREVMRQMYLRLRD